MQSKAAAGVIFSMVALPAVGRDAAGKVLSVSRARIIRVGK